PSLIAYSCFIFFGLYLKKLNSDMIRKSNNAIYINLFIDGIFS
ncbi:MAG: hypothetical protein ACI9TO_001146, partial [Rickettsiales bacterium]